MRNAAAGLRRPGVWPALLAALLFGVGTPAAKLLLDKAVDPWLLAGLLYCGSGVGLAVFRLLARRVPVRPSRTEWLWIAGAITAGGVAGPVLLMAGLAAMSASGASLLLNAEAVLTAVLAWVVFGENAGRRVVSGMVLIVAGAVILSWPGTAGVTWGQGTGPLLVVAACLCWAIDNNLTRKVSLTDETWLAMIKGLFAGPVNLGLGFAAGAAWPSAGQVLGAGLIGLAAYGVSLVLFIIALREVGTARAGAYFSTAPFAGAVLALVLGDPFTWQLGAAGGLMAVGVFLHLTEAHDHEHTHAETTHTHRHRHDDGHHDHDHPEPVSPGTWHTHQHTHKPVTHSHPHTPDAHHRHAHPRSG